MMMEEDVMLSLRGVFRAAEEDEAIFRSLCAKSGRRTLHRDSP